MAGKTLMVALVLMALAAPAVWAGKDKKIAEADVPKAVMDAVKAVIPQAEFVSGEVETHRKRGTVYELNVRDGKGMIHLHVTEAGKITRLTRDYRWEKSIPFEEVPPAVKATLQKIRPDAKILEVDLGRHHDRIVYEIEIRTGTRVEELVITEGGDLLKLEEEDD